MFKIPRRKDTNPVDELTIFEPESQAFRINKSLSKGRLVKTGKNRDDSFFEGNSSTQLKVEFDLLILL